MHITHDAWGLESSISCLKLYLLPFCSYNSCNCCCFQLPWLCLACSARKSNLGGWRWWLIRLYLRLTWVSECSTQLHSFFNFLQKQSCGPEVPRISCSCRKRLFEEIFAELKWTEYLQQDLHSIIRGRHACEIPECTHCDGQLCIELLCVWPSCSRCVWAPQASRGCQKIVT